MTYVLFEVKYGLCLGELIPASVIVPEYYLNMVIETVKNGPYKYYGIYGLTSFNISKNVEGVSLEQWLKKRRKWVRLPPL